MVIDVPAPGESRLQEGITPGQDLSQKSQAKERDDTKQNPGDIILFLLFAGEGDPLLFQTLHQLRKMSKHIRVELEDSLFASRLIKDPIKLASSHLVDVCDPGDLFIGDPH